MYRRYENPFALEDRLEELRTVFCERVEAGATWGELADLQYDIAELEERINHAWQDDEYDSDNYSGDWDY